MGAVANNKRIEPAVDGVAFHKAVKIIVERDELLWLGFDPFSQIGMFQQTDVPALLEFCATNSNYHIVTYTSDDCYMNRYVPDQQIYMLASGDNNPYLFYNPRTIENHSLIEEDAFSKLSRKPNQIQRSRKTKL
jgi:hypothetical protein